MAVNKRKILESAQKHLQKGAIDKALKDYQTLLKADPKDVNVRLKVGDLQLRLGQNEEAIEAYLKVAERFMADGFDAKAVALYKQIGRLDPKRSEVQLPLAELYQRLGLPSDAMAALQAAADSQFKTGAKAAGLELMRRMAALDPTNTTNRLKVAELLRQEGMLAEASAEFEAAAQEFDAQGDVEGVSKTLEQLLALGPERVDLCQRLVRACITTKRLPQAVQLAERAVALQPGSAEVQELLIEALRACGREDALPDAYRRLAALYKERGDEERMRDVLQRFLPGSIGADGDEVLETDDDLVFETGASLELGSAEPDPGFGGDVSLARPRRPTPGRDHGREQAPAARGEHALPPLPRYDAANDATSPRATPASLTAPPGLTAPPAARPPHVVAAAASPSPQRAAAAHVTSNATSVAPRQMPPAVVAASEAAVPEPTEEEAAFDPDQLLAEANVYLRYGKHERAVESLQALLVQRPEHAQALVKLGEALEAVGQRSEAVQALCKAARLARDAGHAAPFEALRTRVAALDAAAAAALEAPIPADPDLLDDVDIDIEADLGGDEEAFADPLPLPAAASTEVDLDARPAARPARETAVPEPSIDIEVAESEVEISETEISLAAELPQQQAPELPREAEPSAPARATTAEQIAAVLEEAAFYQTQGMLDEAEAVCRRILAAVPQQPLALLRLGEIEAARQALASATLQPVLAHETLAPPASRTSAARPEPAADTTAPFSAPTPIAPPPTRESLLPPLESPAELCPEPDDDDDAAGDVSEVTQSLPPVPASAAILQEQRAEPAYEEVGEFDLGKAISDTLAGDSASGRMARHTEEVGIQEVFAAFKKGVERTLGAGDHEARYDLGIAYREMGLLEDALSEFRMALSGPSRRLDCLHMMGLCALDLGRAADAAAHLEQALSHEGVPVSQQVALRFDLARAYESQGDAARALAAFEAVACEDPDFCDVGERVAALRDAALDERKPEPEEEGLESFDDLMAEDAPAVADASEAEELAEAVVAEEFSEAEPAAGWSAAVEVADPEEVPPPHDPQPLAEVDPPPSAGTPASGGETPAPKPVRTGKRKKISFF